jgi:hypothetical protein
MRRKADFPNRAAEVVAFFSAGCSPSATIRNSHRAVINRAGNSREASSASNKRLSSRRNRKLFKWACPPIR